MIALDLQEGEEISSPITLISSKGRPVKIKLRITKKGSRLWLKYPFSKLMNAEIKLTFKGYKYHGFDKDPIKQWSILDCEHNWFQLRFLAGDTIYDMFDKPTVEHEFSRKEPYDHQILMANFWLSRHFALWAAEMGTGKTLASMVAMEYLYEHDQMDFDDVWWVAPRSALHSVSYEFAKWNSPIRPRFITYSSLHKYLDGTYAAPKVVVLDESSRVKNEKPKRSQAAAHLTEQVRRTHGKNGYVLAMSGSPAPKSPADWWHQCEVVVPGYLRESSQVACTHRLAVMEDWETFKKVKCWKDDPKKCDECGEYKNHELHSTRYIQAGKGHVYKPSVDEVAKLGRRMNGLVLKVLKKDCLDLPEKVYQTVNLKPTTDIIRRARLIRDTCPNPAQLLIRLRELSDGFQYYAKETGDKICETCDGTKEYEQPLYIGPEKEDWEQYPIHEYPEYWETKSYECPTCGGKGKVKTYERSYEEIETPKKDALLDLMDLHSEDGRLIVFAGFQASIDNICKIVSEAGWEYIRYDGRGTYTSFNADDWLRIFQEDLSRKIVFVGHPASAGMGLTLTASKSIVYWSNDFNGEARIQSEDRIHRPGSKGANIYDLIHLPSDQFVLDNLKKKRDLQNITFNELKDFLSGI